MEPSTTKQTTRVRWFFAALLAVIVLLVLEGAGRIVHRATTPEPTVPRSVIMFDENLGWKPKPMTRAVSRRTGVPVEYRINSRGLRDDETPYEKPPGVLRIVAVGDSRTFGFGVPIEQHFTRLLEGYFEGVEVINLGVVGYGVDQELLFLRQEGFRYEPDIVIAYVAHFGSYRHMYANRFGRNKPRFELADGELKLTNVPVTRYPIEHSFPRRVHHFLRRSSVLYEILRNALVRILDSESSRDPGRAAASDDPGGSEAFLDAVHDLGAAIVVEMDRESRAHGSRFVLVTQAEELGRRVESEGVLVLDVSEALANLGFVLSIELQHVNEAGNGVLAWEIAEFLRRQSLVTGRDVEPAPSVP